mgnify:FL=1
MDYIYYRMYIWYKRKKDCARINSALFIASIRFFLYFPFMGIAISFFNNGRKDLALILYSVYAVTILMHSLIKYTRQTNSILEKYKHSKYNKTTHNYVIFSTLPISVIGGILFYILLYKTVVIPYALEGKFFYLINRL